MFACVPFIFKNICSIWKNASDEVDTMYYKIKNDILFRQYDGYGYITDNTEFGYRLLNDNRHFSGEKYVSESGAVMLAMLNKVPRHIDDIVGELAQIFVDVEYDTLKQDTAEFFQWFVEEGYLSSGETFSDCHEQESSNFMKRLESGLAKTAVKLEDCTKEMFGPSDFLRSIHIEVASECNERCVHCYIPHEYKNKMIDSKLFYRILEEGREMNIIHVTLSGGEPLLHGDLLGFLAKCRELDLSVNVLSNLTLLTDEIVTEMKKNPLLSVQTSIYSMNSLIHDSITKCKGSLEKTKRGVLKLLSANIPLQISCPVMKQNKDSFVDVIRWGRAHHIAVAVEHEIFASYDRSGSNLINRLSLEDVGEVMDRQISEGYADIMREAAIEKEALTGDSPVCSICRYSFCVSAEGDVFPCVGWQTNIIGNLNRQTVREIWETSEKIRELRQIKRKSFSGCVTCVDRGYCTVCMMCNSNENLDGDAFRINDFHCKVATMIHGKVDMFFQEKSV